MAIIAIEWADISRLRRFDNMLKSLGKDMPKVAARAINRTGDMSRTKVVKKLAEQTGLKQKVSRKAVKIQRASAGKPVYEMSSSGGDIALKFFGARETRKGVSAAPFGQRRIFTGMFTKGGRFPNRVAVPSLGGHVFKRIGKERGAIALQNSGVIIPEQMISGATAAAFLSTVEEVLPRRIEHEIGRLLG